MVDSESAIQNISVRRKPLVSLIYIVPKVLVQKKPIEFEMMIDYVQDMVDNDVFKKKL